MFHAAERETLEEVGLHVTASDSATYVGASPSKEYNVHWIRAELEDESQIQVHKADEVDELRWLTPREIMVLEPLLPTAREGFELLDLIARLQARQQNPWPKDAKITSVKVGRPSEVYTVKPKLIN